ncbi:MAG: ABC transporter permease subunit [Chloroflexota bacterium]|nr:ABC transporter permease subunit [Chloroflexota bacterium]MDE2951470.1 ABC transporter permease subunit [Chloroflexota bacterium]
MGFWERWRIPIMLAPTMAVIILLFIGGLTYGTLVSLGWQPIIGRTEISLQAYQNIIFSEQYASVFWQGLLLTIWVSFASTFLSAVLALATALLLRRSFFGKRLATFLYQLNLPVPHVVAAIGILFLFSQSGLISRAGAQIGIFGYPSDFPVLVRDKYGIGIILSFVWKEVPFVGVIVLAVLQSLGVDYEDLARSLGANRWQRFRYVILPLVMPGLLSGSILVFAFTFGSFEVPAILGVRFPRTLTVTAVRFFRNPDLNARTEGMAISIIISIIVFFLVLGYMWLSRRTIRQD